MKILNSYLHIYIFKNILIPLAAAIHFKKYEYCYCQNSQKFPAQVQLFMMNKCVRDAADSAWPEASQGRLTAFLTKLKRNTDKGWLSHKSRTEM